MQLFVWWALLRIIAITDRGYLIWPFYVVAEKEDWAEEDVCDVAIGVMGNYICEVSESVGEVCLNNAAAVVRRATLRSSIYANEITIRGVVGVFFEGELLLLLLLSEFSFFPLIWFVLWPDADVANVLTILLIFLLLLRIFYISDDCTGVQHELLFTLSSCKSTYTIVISDIYYSFKCCYYYVLLICFVVIIYTYALYVPTLFLSSL